MSVLGHPRQQVAMRQMVSNGYPPFAAAALVGNACQESGYELDSTFDRGARANFGSGGICEWRDSSGAPRKSRLKVFADERGPNLESDLGTQVDYAIYELGKYFAQLDRQLRNPLERTIANLTANFCWIYENPNKAEAGLDNRIAHAQKAHDDWVAEQSVTVPPKPTPVPLPPIYVPTPPTYVPAPPQVQQPIPVPSPPPISPTTAGRQAAVLDQLLAIQQKYDQEIAALQAERAVIAQSIQSFSGFLPPPPVQPQSLPPPPAAPAKASPIQRKGTSTMLGTSWQTTAAGIGSLLGAAATVLNAISHGQMPDPATLGLLLSAITAGVGLLRAKDADVTGGTVAATQEATNRVAK